MGEILTHRMYGGSVTMEFNPDSPRYRYTVTDAKMGLNKEPVRGVTTLLGDIIAKPDLMKWPMNMSNTALFGAKFDEVLKDYVHDWNKAEIKPDTPYTAEQLHEAMKTGSRAHTKRSDTGKDVGTAVHAMVEAYLKKLPYGFPEEMPTEERKMAGKAFDSFVKWWEGLSYTQVIRTEAPVYSRRLNYAGTMDLIAEINGKIYLMDIKTTNVSGKAPLGIYAEYFMQLAGYSYAYREENGGTFNDLGIIRVGKDGKLNVITARDLGLTVDECERAFAFACRIHDWLSVASKFLSDGRMNGHLNPAPEVVEGSASNKLEAISV